jgi:ribosome-associated heat shock protein Hsp15
MSTLMPPAGPAEVRLDKWLWAVRLFKTRGDATEACGAGHVKINGQRAKPARHVHPGELIEAQVGAGQRRLRVVTLIDRRVGARLAAQCLEDLTPPEALQKPAERPLEPLFHRPKSTGRPTKRERRLLEQVLGPDPLGAE